MNNKKIKTNPHYLAKLRVYLNIDLNFDTKLL